MAEKNRVGLEPEPQVFFLGLSKFLSYKRQALVIIYESVCGRRVNFTPD
jgi:hypothetical protein